MGLIFAIGIYLTVLLEAIILRAKEKAAQALDWKILPLQL
jgi:hypothetical protein